MEQPGTLAWATLKRVGRRMKQPVDARVSSARRARRRERVEQAEAAARVAAVHDSAFAPETLVSAAEALFRLVQLAWDARDRRRLDTLLEPQLREAWTHAMAGFEEDGPRSHAEVSGNVHVDLVGFSGADPPRMVVLIETALRTFKEANGGRPEPGKVDRLCQYWTLVRRDRAWHVLGIEERAQGAYHLEEPLDNSAAAEPAGTAVTA
jgi:predicted lipid-binding transport protein (Tim44 family)